MLMLLTAAVLGCNEGKKHPTLRSSQPSNSVAPTQISAESYPASLDLSKSGAQAIEHNIVARLEPAENIIDATDSIIFNGRGTPSAPIICVVAKTIRILNVLDADSSRLLSFEEREISEYDGFYKAIIFNFPKNAPSKPKAIINYIGVINDPVKESSNLRFLVGDFTRGIISPDGIYLSGASGWYPHTWNSMAIYRFEAISPRSFDIISAGNLINREKTEEGTVTIYKNDLPMDNLDVAGGVYSVSSKVFDDVRIETFFHPDDSELAPAYMNAAATYIREYSKLLGKYPYNRFSIVSNFFPTGYGMPAYTLLGRQVIQRMHTQEYALGHEVVHNWWGNGVFVDWQSGNWCEGLTTYCANYYWHEMVEGEDSATAVEYRRKTLQRYKTMVEQQSDYPLRKFTSKTEEKDNEIGYTKSMMFFHQIRLAIGKKAFFDALKRLRNEFLGKRASWNDLRGVFEAESGKDLKNLFNQWLDRPGLPALNLFNMAHRPSGAGYEISFSVSQREPVWDLYFDAVVVCAGNTKRVPIMLNKTEQTISVSTESEPVLLSVDPDAQLLRDISDDELRPCLNRTLWSGAPTIYLAEEAGKPNPRFAALGKRIADMRNSEVKTMEGFQVSQILGKGSMFIGKASVLDAQAELMGLFHLPPSELIRRKLISIGKASEDDLKNIAYLVSVDLIKGGTATFFGWFDNEPPPHLDRVLFFYGWQGLVVFSSGSKISEGTIAPRSNPLEMRIKVEKKPVATASIDISDGLSDEEATAALNFLTSEELKGRMSGTEGSRKTAEYLASVLKRGGFSPAYSNSYLQKFSFSIRQIGGISVSWKANKSATGVQLPAFGSSWPNTDALPLVFSGNGKMTRPVAYAGTGINCAALGINDYSAFEQGALRGRIVLIDSAPPTGIEYFNESVQYENRRELSLFGRAKAAVEQGAAAVIFLADRQTFLENSYEKVTFTNYLPRSVREKYYSGDPSSLPADDRLTVANLQSRQAEMGSSLSIPVIVVFGKFAIAHALLPDDFAIELSVELSSESVESNNVVAMIQGSDASAVTNAIVLAAHYDHNGTSKSGSYFPGANDNAAGVVALLGIAAELKKTNPKNTYIILFTGAEEWGTRGAIAYLADPAIPIARTSAFLNLDMVGIGEGNKAYMIGANQNPFLATLLKSVAEPLGIEIKSGIDHAIAGSDQWPFHCRSVASLTLTTGRYPQYNTSADKPEILSLKAIRSAINLWTELAKRIDVSERAPKPNDVYSPMPKHPAPKENTTR